MLSRADFWFFFRFRVRYSEVDQQGIVFNSHYLTYFDTALTEYMRALDYDYRSQLRKTGTDFHVVRSVIDYKMPIHFDEEIDASVRTARIGRSSFNFQLAVFAKDQDDIRAVGEIVWVNADQTTRQPAPVPQELKALILKREQPD
jgi:acyl-CoA thioester hydrolase